MELLRNITFCPQNESLWTVWEDHGLSRCFSYTLTSSLLALWITMGGLSEWWIYRKYGNQIERRVLVAKPVYTIQLLLVWLLIFLVIGQLVIDFLRLDGQSLYGFNILWSALMCFSWLLSLYLVHLERCFGLPSVPTGGHGLILLIFWTGALVADTILLVNLNSPVWFFHMASHKDQMLLALYVSRFFITLWLFLLGLKAPGMPRQEDYLLGAGIPYTLHVRDNSMSTWSGFGRKMRRLLPFLWPKGNCKLQLAVFFCFVILVAGRILTPISPILLKKIVDGLGVMPGHKREFLWQDILAYSSLILVVQGSNSLFSNLRNILWIRVQQFTTKYTQVKLYEHLHSLSLSWHLSRKTGDVLRVLDRGTQSVNSLLSYMLFQIFPAIADTLIAFGYFTYAFNLWFGLIVLFSIVIYSTLTISISEWRTKFRREMNLLDNAAQAKGVDALLNFETVKYYNAEEVEVREYANCVDEYQKAEWKTSFSLAFLNILQSLTVNAGSVTGSLLCAYMVYKGDSGMTAGDFVLFIAYISQMYTPLNFLGTYYRVIQKSFIDMENMFELLDHQPDVVDHHGAIDLKLDQGQIEFRDVCFSYNNDRPILKQVSFVVPPGHTVAFVGQTGAGKSTLVRLLFRFYDVKSGTILIDGQNIAFVKQKSLRSHIGVVPQDTVLFNSSILENIRYGRPSATDDEVIDAARSAEIHDSILQMPNKYETVVGERGLKLSGGEKQRVAIARTILKAPSIIILDEATSALDTRTERRVQKALSEIVKGKTTIVVAHRLSTIVKADQIIVLEDGEIVEQGNHKELLSLNKKYAAMWFQQLEEERQISEAERRISEAEPGPSGIKDETL
ncbi:ATP-binding cassette sub-family B member 6, mitochondrial [Galendromus occidentalis]|uniref:ATP-binding cassette sub-family B member 6 n=1 Tax=Galendromus occidentalis TaxID=34638 RepID=A0AAJ6QX10_9ACAR|nr:ATP-binding cassette sub-family B member 6, mitochondrial [Galendromus occidentalis]